MSETAGTPAQDNDVQNNALETDASDKSIQREKSKSFKDKVLEDVNKYFLILVLIVSAFLIYAAATQDTTDKIKLSSAKETLTFAISLIGIIAVSFTVIGNYLRGNARSQTSNFDSEAYSTLLRTIQSMQYENARTRDEIDKSIGRLKDYVINQAHIQPVTVISNEQQLSIHQAMVDAMKHNLTLDFFSQLKKSIVSQIAEDKKEQLYNLAQKADASISRLTKEIEQLTRRANTNLNIGGTVTVAALAVLGYFILIEDFSENDVVVLALRFIPRLSLVLFIELFSFFFLKLYRASLGEIKYYQNELTNLEARSASMIFAANYGSDADVSNVIKEMTATERNFKLQKGESTVELEKNKFESDFLKELLKASAGVARKEK